MFSLFNGINLETNNRTICGKYLNIWKLNNTFLNDSEIKEETNKKLGSIGSGRSPEEGNDNPLQYSCLRNPMDRGPWWATIHGVTKSHIRLSTMTTKKVF